MAWVPVNDAQMGSWAPILVGAVSVTEFDGPGGAAVASIPVAGKGEFSYLPNAVAWLPVVDDNTTIWTPIP